VGGRPHFPAPAGEITSAAADLGLAVAGVHHAQRGIARELSGDY